MTESLPISRRRKLLIHRSQRNRHKREKDVIFLHYMRIRRQPMAIIVGGKTSGNFGEDYFIIRLPVLPLLKLNRYFLLLSNAVQFIIHIK